MSAPSICARLERAAFRGSDDRRGRAASKRTLCGIIITMNAEKDKKVQPYEKPRLRVIELTADEVMAVGCKTVSTRGPFKAQPPCAPCLRVGS